MSLISDESCECTNSELDLFEVLPTQTSVDESRYESFHPLTSIERGGPVEFRAQAGENEYMDLSESLLYFSGVILDDKGEAIDDTVENNNIPALAKVFPINYLGATAFKNIEITLNSKSISTLDGMYAYRAYLESLLSFGHDAKRHQLTAAMFHKDSGDMDEFGTTIISPACTNKGAKTRFNRTKGSKKFECISKIHADIFQQEKAMLSKVTVGVKFTRADEDFILMALTETNKYTFKFDKVVLYVKIKKIASHVQVAHEERLLSSNAKYPLKKVEMKFFTKGSNRSDLSEQNLVTGTLPTRLVCGMVYTDAFNGNKHLNPFNFGNMDLSYISCKKNGQNVPLEPIELDFKNNEFLMGYFSLMHGTGLWSKNKSNDILPLKDFEDGYALFCFDLSPNGNNGSYFNLVQEGTLGLHIKLKKASEKSITIITYMEYDTILEIDSNRNVYLNE